MRSQRLMPVAAVPHLLMLTTVVAAPVVFAATVPARRPTVVRALCALAFACGGAGLALEMAMARLWGALFDGSGEVVVTPEAARARATTTFVLAFVWVVAGCFGARWVMERRVRPLDRAVNRVPTHGSQRHLSDRHRRGLRPR